MVTPRSLGAPQMTQLRRSGMPWAIDNGAFSGRFDAERWLAWLRAVPKAARVTCLFAVAPDVVGDAEATLWRSMPFLSSLRGLGYRVAYASQDGATEARIPWEDIDCLFIGGTDAWKFSPASLDLARTARERYGLWVHVGRVQTGRFAACRTELVDSADGTVLKFDPGRLPMVTARLDRLNAQMTLTEVMP